MAFVCFELGSAEEKSFFFNFLNICLILWTIYCCVETEADWRIEIAKESGEEVRKEPGEKMKLVTAETSWSYCNVWAYLLGK